MKILKIVLFRFVLLQSIIFLSGLLCFGSPNKTNQQAPNFLIFIADDSGLDLGCYGNRVIKTPHIDDLARQGMIFENAFLTSPQCSPSRISILTGKYLHTTRTEDLHTPLPEGEKFLTGSFGFSRDFVFSERNWHDCDEHMRCVRSERYKLILNAYTEKLHGTPADLANNPSWFSLLEKRKTNVLSNEQKLIFTITRPSVELFDLYNDQHEYVNLAYDPKFRSISYDLLHILRNWMNETNDFPPSKRMRLDHTNRITGIRYYDVIPELENDLEE